MNIFENKKISLLKEKIELYRKNAHNEGRFSLFDAKFAIDVFPKNMVNNDGQLADGVSYSDVYDLSEKYPKIKKEFMIGAILKKNNGFDEFYTRNEIVNVKDNVSLGK